MTVQSPSGSGPSEDLAELHRLYRTPLMRFFMRRVHNHADAEDLVQEVFTRLARRGPGEPIEKPANFIFRTASNLALDRRRAAITHAEHAHFSISDVTEKNLPSALIEDSSAEHVLQLKQTLDQAMNWLDELGGVTKQIFILHRLERMSHNEIAAIFELSNSSVEKHLARAMAHLMRKTRSPS
jgi:RNA polymerase sigma factor (sigma-70 family)